MTKTLLDVLQLGTQCLDRAGLQGARRLTEEAIAYSLGINRLDIYLQFDRPIFERELTQLRCILARYARGEPMAYIAGEVEFLNLIIAVSPDVLIPRPETELLVEKIVSELKSKPTKNKILVDVGCGSGCIGLAIKAQIPSLTVVLSDVCPMALAVAASNANRLGLEVEIRQGDWLADFMLDSIDYVVSNPPYVSMEEWIELSESVKNFEPKGAFIAGQTGLECYHILAQQIPPVLRLGGKAWFEIGKGQGAPLTELFRGVGFSQVACSPDWAGHDRFLMVE